MGTQLRLLRLAVSCPRCGSRPSVRITEQMRDMMMRAERDELMESVQCQRRQCACIYEVTARAFQLAS